MASTLTLTRAGSGKNEIYGTEHCVVWTLDVTAYDATTNIDLTPSQLGVSRITRLEVSPIEPAVNADMKLIWDGSTTAPEMTAYVSSTGAEVADTTDLGTWQLVVYGK